MVDKTGQGIQLQEDEKQIATVELTASRVQAIKQLQGNWNPSVVQIQSATAGRAATFADKRLPGRQVFPDGHTGWFRNISPQNIEEIYLLGLLDHMSS